MDTASIVQTSSFDVPVLDFCLISSDSNDLLVSLDRSWGVLRENPSPSNPRGVVKDAASEEVVGKMQDAFRVTHIGALGEVPRFHIVEIAQLIAVQLTETPSGSSSITRSLIDQLSAASPLASQSEIASLDLYPGLPLFPRWTGLEEDDDLAGPAADRPGTPASAGETEMPGQNYTQEELERLSPKELGRLRSRGIDVKDLIARKKKMQKGIPGRRVDVPVLPTANEEQSGQA